MEVFFEHLLKSFGVLLLFLVSYHLFLKKETQFVSNRWFLVAGLVLSLALPFVTLTKTVVREPLEASTALAGTISNQAVGTSPFANNAFDWMMVALVIYLLGVCFFSLKLIHQINAIKQIKKQAEIIEEDECFHVRTRFHISPFSFFRHIFYHPNQFERRELETILAHEKVHVRQMHTLDILLAEAVFILQWCNPVVWMYKSAIKQNLEFLADSKTCEINDDKKFYQYLMLKQATKHSNLAIANPFYNSITRLTIFGKTIAWFRPFGQVKKRIVMLNQNQSKKMNLLKLFLILPFLAVFLMAFNTKKVYVPTLESPQEMFSNHGKSIELIIDKNTTDEELAKIKSDLAKDGVDFSYTVVHNDTNEIIDISIQMSGKNSDGESFSGTYHTNSEGPIKPITIFYDDDSNSISFGNSSSSMAVGKRHLKKGHNTWVTSDDEESKEIIIKKINGKRTVIVDGEEVDDEELHKMDINIEEGTDIHWDSSDGKKVKMKKMKKGKGKNVFIMKDSDDESDIEVINGGDDIFFMMLDGEGPELYFIDGKKVTQKEVKALSPNAIATVNVYKGDKAIEKHGKKAKNGVVEIITKKKE